jgi:hypothetical protein
MDFRGGISVKVRKKPVSPLRVEGEIPAADPTSVPLHARARDRRPGNGSTVPPRRKISKASRGRKRQRSGGGTRDLNTPRQVKDVVGDWLDWGMRIVELGQLPIQRPINDHARALLVDFLRRNAFWRSMRGDAPLPVAFAGETFLCLKSRQAYKVLAELEDAGSPHLWLRAKATAEIAAGRIGHGQETCRCSIADRFYTELAGGVPWLLDLKVLAFGGNRKVTVAEALNTVAVSVKLGNRPRIDLEVTSYMIYRNIKGG